MKIVLTESQLNSLVEGTKTVFKDEEKLKHEVETHLSEEKECECECNKGGLESKRICSHTTRWFNARINVPKMDSRK